jgi:predicted metal-dependent phosphoesterase TrpH
MLQLKAQLHTHTKQDPRDRISYSEYELIDQAAKLGYDVLAITCHNVLIFNEDLSEYAAQKGILLIPGIEKEIEEKRVIILNAQVAAQGINSFFELKLYKQQFPNSLIIAPNPFYWRKYALKEKLIEHAKLFDAIEESYYYCQKFNKWNAQAREFAAKHHLPIIGSSDTHILKYMDNAYSVISCREKSINSVLEAIKQNQLKIFTQELDFADFLRIPMNITFNNLVRKTFLLS